MRLGSGSLLLFLPRENRPPGSIVRFLPRRGRSLYGMPLFFPLPVERPGLGSSSHRAGDNILAHVDAFSPELPNLGPATPLPATFASLPLQCLSQPQACRETAQTDLQSSKPRLGSGTLLLCPPLKPIHPGNLQDRPHLNEAGTLTGRPLNTDHGEKRSQQIKSLGPCTHRSPKPKSQRPGVVVTHGNNPRRGHSHAFP